MNTIRLPRTLPAGQLALTGTLDLDGQGNFTLKLDGAGTEAPGPEPPDPEPPEPDNVVTITPSGGDDTGKLQDALNSLQSGWALMCSGMFSVGNTLWLDGQDKTLMADPAKPSGFRPSRSGFNGHYGALLCTTVDAARCRITGLEFDGQGKQVEMVFFDGGSGNQIDSCYLHHIAFSPAGAPFAAIHSQHVSGLKVLKNRIEHTTGVDGGEGVRGIWICGQAGNVIAGNTVRDTGHTGISLEGVNGLVAGNIVEGAMVQGTGYKVVYRGSGVYRKRRAPKEPGFQFLENLVTGTVGAGLMLENCNGVGVRIEENSFENCGRQGTTFGGLYSSSNANGVVARNNRFEGCKSIGGFRNLFDSTFEDNTIISGSDVIWLEDNCHNLTVNQSGRVNIGSNVTEIWVDGVKVA